MSRAAPAERALGFAVSAMGAEVLAGGPPAEGVTFAGGASDSREVSPGRLFFALPGERVDGFSFAAQAAASGAAAIVVAAGRGRPPGCERIPVLAVPDPRRALGDLGRAVRALFKGRVVGVTGSNGKTTTKELVAAALAPSGAVAKTAGNRNTEVGLPLTLLDASGNEAFWVLEMAMRGLGEIALLCEIGSPHVGVVTNIAAAHIGRLGSLDAIARAKGEIFHGLGAAGIGVLPADEPRLEQQAAHLPESRKLRFAGGRELPAGRAVATRVLDFVPAGPSGSIVRYAVADSPHVVRLPLAGEHNAKNGAAALAVALALNLDIAKSAAGLADVELPPHRSRPIAMGGRIVIDDCYNANPASMQAALRMLVATTGSGGRAAAIVGDMLELGDDAEAQHRELGRQAASLGLVTLAAVGDFAQAVADGAHSAGLPTARVLATKDPAAAAAHVARTTAAGDVILVKASRGVRLERALEALATLWKEPR